MYLNFPEDHQEEHISILRQNIPLLQLMEFVAESKSAIDQPGEHGTAQQACLDLLTF